MSFISLPEALEKLNISEAELKQLVQENNVQVFMSGQDESGKKTICFKEDDFEKLSGAQNTPDFDLTDQSDDLGIEINEGPTTMLDLSEDDSSEKDIELFEDDNLDLDDEAAVADAGDDDVLIDDEDNLELNDEATGADTGDDDLLIDDEDDLDLDLSEDDLDLDVDDIIPEDDDISFDATEDTLALDNDAADATLSFDDDSDELLLDDADTLSLDDDDGGGVDTLSIDDDDGALDTLSIDDDLQTEETLSFDVANEISLPDESFSLDDDQDIDLDEDSAHELRLDDEDEEESSASARIPMTKIVDEPSAGPIWPICALFSFIVLGFCGMVSIGLVYDMKMDRGITFAKSFYAEVNSVAKEYIGIPK